MKALILKLSTLNLSARAEEKAAEKAYQDRTKKEAQDYVEQFLKTDTLEKKAQEGGKNQYLLFTRKGNKDLTDWQKYVIKEFSKKGFYASYEFTTLDGDDSYPREPDIHRLDVYILWGRFAWLRQFFFRP